MATDLYVLATALIASVGLTPAARHIAVRYDVIDRPGQYKLHLAPIPLLGGLAIYAATVLATLLFLPSSEARVEVLAILAGATLLVVVGLLDDRGTLHPQLKLMIAMPVAAVVLIISGIRIDLPLSLFVPSSSPVLVMLSSGLTIFWVVGITAAFNILDHMDGLCAGIAAIASAFFLIFANMNGQVLVGTLAAASLGASLGFLWWNFNPAKIFMGDGGAMFLGFIIATLGIKLRLPNQPQETSWMIPVLVLGAPIFDTTLIIISRARRSLLPFSSPGKDHTAHRLANLGLGQRGAVLVMYGVGICLGLLALLLTRLSGQQAYVVAAVVVAVGFFAIAALEGASYGRS